MSVIPKSIVQLIDSSSASKIKLIIRAKPGAKKSQIVSIDDDAIGVQIAAPPREGAANEELIDYFSHVLGVKTRYISLDIGQKSRNKILLINFETKTKSNEGGMKQKQQQQQPMTAEKIFEILKQDMDG
ncbi:hypothetical protein DERP_009450 [Dermatophagoides pteronyssinus]|uniref:Uncharacterized protein n=1 Tax=Dermatophagoides pteronyssinus TaxID=6956 RepID=A0ABQ8IUC9_DERPT|nr:hypothetical protein DERP_009450 [Dermatophagoides pteronyssinus]